MLTMITEDHTGRPQRLRAETYEGLVEEMHAIAFVREESAQAYMVEVARRRKLWDGGVIRTDSAEHFLTDLDACGSVRLATDGASSQ